jgi:hypothetical protein
MRFPPGYLSGDPSVPGVHYLLNDYMIDGADITVKVSE